MLIFVADNECVLCQCICHLWFIVHSVHPNVVPTWENMLNGQVFFYAGLFFSQNVGSTLGVSMITKVWVGVAESWIACYFRNPRFETPCLSNLIISHVLWLARVLARVLDQKMK